MLALKRAQDGDGFILRVRETTGQTVQATLRWLGREIALGLVRGNQIACWRVTPSARGWLASPTDLLEEPLERPTDTNTLSNAANCRRP
jgi:hypothetical protein